MLLYCKAGKETKTFSTLLVYYLSQIKHVNYCRRGKLRLHIPLPVPYSASYKKKNISNISFKNMVCGLIFSYFRKYRKHGWKYGHIFENMIDIVGVYYTKTALTGAEHKIWPVFALIFYINFVTSFIEFYLFHHFWSIAWLFTPKNGECPCLCVWESWAVQSASAYKTSVLFLMQ